MFSLDEGTPVAVIRGDGKYDGEIIRLVKEPEQAQGKLHSKISFAKSSSYKIYPLPGTETRSCFFIAGASGSGKSFLTNKIAAEYRIMFPQNDIILISRLGSDTTLDEDELEIKRLNLDDESFLEQKIDGKMLHDSLVIFDDTDTIRNKEINKEVKALRLDLLETARHMNVDIITTSHKTHRDKELCNVIDECPNLVFFPSSGSSTVDYFLEKHCGISKKNERDLIRKLSSRWVLINKSIPRYLMTEKSLFILNHYLES